MSGFLKGFERDMGVWKYLLAGFLSISVILGVASTYHYRRKRDDSTIWWFHQAGSNPGHIAPVAMLLSRFGEDRAAEILADMASQYDCFAFDESARFCQIHRAGFEFEGEGASDAALLTSTARVADSTPSAMWHGPPGFRIDRVAFTEVGLNVWGRGSDADVADDPIEYLIPWLAGDKPRSGVISPKRTD